MMLKTPFTAFILVLTLASSIIVLTSFSSFSGISDIIHSYVVQAFKATTPNNPNNNTNLIHPNNTNINHPPVADVGPPQLVKENSTVMLVGAASDPDPNSKLTYSWSQIAGPAVILKGTNTAFPTFTTPSNLPLDTELKFALIAKDNKGASSNPAIAVITIMHINHPPVANAGTDQTVNQGYIATLDGSKSKDLDNGDSLTYSWKQIGGPTVILNNATSSMATFTAHSNIPSDTTLVFKLTVKDNKNATSASTVKVTDKYIPPLNQPPTANPCKDQTVNAGDKVTLNGSGSRDPDGTIVSYRWMQTSGPPVTLSGADTSPTFTAPIISSDTALKFSLTVKDDKGVTSNNPAIVTVTVKPTIQKSAISTIPSNATATTTATPSNATATTTATPSNATATTSNQAKVNLANEYVFFRKWGSGGTGDGQFYIPYGTHVGSSDIVVGSSGIAVDSSGNVYVADSGNTRVQKFDSNGKFITQWGYYGDGDGQFSDPEGIAVDSSGNVYVADSDRDRIQKFDSNGKFITKWGSGGTGDGQFSDPQGIAVDSSGNVYVVDYFNNRIQKFDSNGKFITKWGSTGTGDGQFVNPSDISVDSSGNVYVADNLNDRIQKFDSNGKFITKWGSTGTGDGQFRTLQGIAVDSSGNVYVVDYGNDRIQKFDSNGKFITKWGSQGSGDGQFNRPFGITVDSYGNVYVADPGNNRVQVFALSNNSSR